MVDVQIQYIDVAILVCDIAVDVLLDWMFLAATICYCRRVSKTITDILTSTLGANRLELEGSKGLARTFPRNSQRGIEPYINSRRCIHLPTHRIHNDIIC